MDNKPNRKYKCIYAHEDDCVMFEMENGYFYLYDTDMDKISAYFDPYQYERFDPYMVHDQNVDPELLKKAEKALQTLPVVNHSRNHIHETNL